jgi:hypothetical protein
MSDLSRAEFLIHLERVHGGIQGVQERLDNLNGRTRACEQDVAILKDRTDTVRRDTRRSVGKWGLGVGGLMAIAEALHRALG